jgi:hypothetical protein
MRKALSIAAFLTAMAVSPAFAASELCTDAHMQKMDKMIAEMSDAAAKKQATMHLDMSKAEMKKGNEQGACRICKKCTRQWACSLTYERASHLALSSNPYQDWRKVRVSLGAAGRRSAKRLLAHHADFCDTLGTVLA